MTLTIDLSEDVQARLAAEATRRGITLDALVADLAEALPLVTANDPLELFIGCGDSGLTDPFDIHFERKTLARTKSINEAI